MGARLAKACGEEGFALPSVLMLMLLLTVLAISVLLMQHLRHMQAVMELARVRADLAAQSGIAHALCEVPGEERGLTYLFADSSIAHVRVRPWGLLTLAECEGQASHARASRVALLGATPPTAYGNALTYGNPSRQLILTGSASISGDVALGPMGASVGTLPGERQPRHLPIVGSIRRGAAGFLPPFDARFLTPAFRVFDGFLGGRLPASVSGVPALQSADLSTIPDSIETAVFEGSAFLAQKVPRRERPLDVFVRGDLTIASGALVEGLVAFYATGRVRIATGGRCENTVIMSAAEVEIDSGVVFRGQVIAPSITVGADVRLRYPSILCSRECPGARSARKITLSRRSRTEGMVILLRAQGANQLGDLVVLDPEAVVFGALHAEGAVTLDGKVEGTALIEDLFFYHAPTSYHGWIRSGLIHRAALPEGFAVPPSLSGGSGEVMLWL